jgi:hypothetical protein
VPFPDDALSQDVLKDLERVDGVMTRVIGDPKTTEEFIRDPNGVLTRLGLHPRTTRRIHDRANRIFYAVLTNTELMELVADRMASFAGFTEDADNVLDAALKRGEIEHPLELDMAAIDHFREDREFLRRIFQVTLHDLNNRRILENVYSTEQLDDYIDRLTSAIHERRGIRDFPVLEAWDERYGIGPGYGGLFVEVGPLVTAAVGVEFAAAVTVWGFPPRGGDSMINSLSRGNVLRDALRGDPVAARQLATVGAMLKLAGEIQIHAINFERR